jgi:voltage-gated potassium channel
MAHSARSDAARAASNATVTKIATTLLYFIYVTLLTIGYGDITPVSPAARALVVLEGLLRMAFTTMLLAVLVAKALGRREDV